MVICGEQHITWSSLEFVCRMLASPRIRDQFQIVTETLSACASELAVSAVISMQACRGTLARDGRLELRSLLRTSIGLNASDTRDRVYGLLGMSDLASKIEVDYTISPQEVFKRATIGILNTIRT